MGTSRIDSVDERGRICKKSWSPRGCARYRRPAMRLARSGKRTLTGRTPHSSPPLIAEGVLSHILQECRAKALAAESNNTTDGLYGSGANDRASGKLFCNASNFEGSIALKKRAGGHRRSISPTTPQELVAEEEQSAASARGPGADAANDKTPDSVPEVDANATDFQRLPEEEPTPQSESRDDNAQPLPEPVPEADANDAQSLRTNTNEIGVQVGDAIPPNGASLSDGEAEPSRGGSSNTLPPFIFMPGPPRRPSTPMRASSASLEAIFLQNADLYTCKSPIRPRTSKCPIMSPVDSPLSLYGLQCISSSTETDRGTSTTAQCPSPTSSHPSASSALPFDFISVRNPTTLSSFSDVSGAPALPAETTPSSSGCLDSLMRHIFAFAAKWLPKLNPTSSMSAPPSSSEPKGDFHSMHPQRAAETVPDRSDAPQDHRSTLLPPPSVVRSHSLRTDENQIEVEDERSAASQSSGSAIAHHVRSATAFSTPPRGWEQLFQPKEGEWKCEACYFINPSEALTCDSCTALKDAPQPTNSPDVDDTTSGGNIGEALREDSARSGGSSTEERNNDAEAPSVEENESETESEEETVCDDTSPSKRIKVSAPTPAKARRTALTLSDEEAESSEEEEEQEVSPSKRVKVSAPTPAKARAAPTPAKALRATTLFESVEEEEEEEREVSPSKRVKVGGGVSINLNIIQTQPAVSHSLEAAGDGSPSKRTRRDSGANGNSNAAQSIFGHSPDAILKMAQKRGKKSGSGKRMKVDRPQGLGGDVYASGVSANAFGSTQLCDGTLNQQSTPRGDIGGLAMDESLSYSFSTEETVMEVESPRGSTMSFS